jgi:DNA-binding NarL/FixJ family response regulator
MTARSDDEFTDSGLPLDPYWCISAQAALSSRDREVLFYLAQAKSNKDIARLSNISETTVKAHVKSILRKTNTQDRTQAAIWAIEHGYSGTAGPVWQQNPKLSA